MFKKFFHSRLNQLAYGSVAAFGLFFWIFKMASGSGGYVSWRASSLYFYLEAVGNSFKYIAVGGAYFMAILLIFLVLVSQVKNFAVLARHKGKPMILGSDSFDGAFRNGGKIISEAFLAALPALLLVIVMSFFLDVMNSVNRTRLIDLTLMAHEHFLFGGYVFMMLGNLPYPAWFAQFIVFSFESMSGLLLIAAFIAASFELPLLRRFATAFSVCMLFLSPFWLLFPALSPQDRFIDNVYHLPVPTQISAALANYHPVPIIENFLISVRATKQGLADLPTSTLPSPHAAWAALAGFYLFRTRKWLGWISLPFLIGSTMGTVILAQHYFLDPIIGIIIAGLAIWITEKMGVIKEISN